LCTWALAAITTLAPLHSQAQDTWPTRPIRLVVGFAAGGSTDIPARYVADKLGNLLGQRVAVENKSGAAGMLATREVLAQPRDGRHRLGAGDLRAPARAARRHRDDQGAVSRRRTGHAGPAAGPHPAVRVAEALDHSVRAAEATENPRRIEPGTHQGRTRRA